MRGHCQGRQVVVASDHEPEQQRRLAARLRLHRVDRHAGRLHGGRSSQDSVSRRSSTRSSPRATSRIRSRRRTCSPSIRTSTRFRSTANPTVSDGPFRFAEWARGDHITLARNDGFFLGKPGLDTIEIKVVPDEDTSVNLLRTHEIDYMFQASHADLSASCTRFPTSSSSGSTSTATRTIQLNCSHDRS